MFRYFPNLAAINDPSRFRLDGRREVAGEFDDFIPAPATT